MKLLSTCLLFALFATSPVSSGQEQRPPRPRVVPQPPQTEQKPNDFPGNVKLTLEGSLYGHFPTDWSVIAGGPEVSMSFPGKVGSGPAPNGTFQATLIPGAPWVIRLTISARVPSETSPNNYEYRNLSLETTVHIALGKKVTLWEAGDQRLTLGLEELKE